MENPDVIYETYKSFLEVYNDSRIDFTESMFEIQKQYGLKLGVIHEELMFEFCSNFLSFIEYRDKLLSYYDEHNLDLIKMDYIGVRDGKTN